MKKTYERECTICQRPFTATHPRTRKCDQCRTADPHRHSARSAKYNYMLVGVDCEGNQSRKFIKGRLKKRELPLQPYMYLRSISIGREDGSRDTYLPTEEDRKVPGRAEIKALLWLVNRLHKPYVDATGKKWKQVPVAYHFNWDISTLLKEFNPERMHLVRKTQVSIQTYLCGSDHTPEECPRVNDVAAIQQQLDETAEETGSKIGKYSGTLHRYNSDDVQAVLGDGGETDLLAYDPDTNLAISATPGRRLWVEIRPHGDLFKGWRKADVHDVGRAFVGGFEAAIDSWNVPMSEHDRELIARGKKARKVGFKGYTDRDIADYSEAECVALALLVRKLINTIQDAARVVMRESQVFGSGAIAGATMKHYKVPRRNKSDLEHEKISQMTYFGGLIEAPVIGLILDVILEPEDINSAYPSKAIRIPCTRAGHGEHVPFDGDNYPEDALLGNIQATWFISPVGFWKEYHPGEPVPEHHREYSTEQMPFIDRWKDGSVACPRFCKEPRYVPLAEYTTAKQWFPESIAGHGGWYWRQDCECDPPFAFIEGLYDKRQIIKSQMDDLKDRGLKGSGEWWELEVQQNAIKLIINSIYGKLAQQRPTMGTYTNIHLASYITGATRAQARERIWQHEAVGGKFVYCHTDGITVIGGAEKHETKVLGEWGAEKKFSSLLTLQPGLAVSTKDAVWDEKKERWIIKGKKATRGVNETEYIRALLKWQTKVNFRKHPRTWPELVVKQKRMVSRRQALSRGKPWLAGTFEDITLRLNVHTRKRNFDGAHQLVIGEGDTAKMIKTAWQLPPIHCIPADQRATLDDIGNYKSAMERRYLKGDFDGAVFR